jgi:putative hydrolase of the HAD superfamily
MLRALTFDLWGTLYNAAYGDTARIALLHDALARLGQPRSLTLLRAAYDHTWSIFDAAWRTEHRSLSVDRWLREMLAYGHVDAPEGALAHLRRPIEEVLLCEDGPVLVAGVGEVLPRLAQRYKLGVISDVGLTPGRVLREILRRDGLLDLFSTLTFSDEVGATKPVARVFHRTLAVMGSRPDEAVHIGDLPETDLAGARAAGMCAVLFLGISRREDGLPLADAAFSDYRQLEDVLADLDGGTGCG